MTKKLAILSIEDSNADFLLVERQLQTDGIDCQCQRVDDQESLSIALQTGHWDLVISDYCVPGLYFPEVLAQVKQHSPSLPLIIVSGTIGEAKGAMMVKLGASDFVSKEFLDDLVPTIKRHICVDSARA